MEYIKVDEHLYFEPKHLLVIDGNNITEPEIDLLEQKVGTGYLNISNPMDEIKAMYGSDTIDYDKCFPITGGICVSEKCQLRCNYCSFSSDEDGKDKIVNAVDAKAFIDFLIRNYLIRRLTDHNVKEMLFLYFAGGGEPTYDWKVLTELIEYIKKKTGEKSVAYSLGITTNALINEKQIKYIAENFDNIVISFDGLPELQNKNRVLRDGGKTFNFVDGAIKYLSEAGKNVLVRTTIWPEDYSEIVNIINFIHERYAKLKYLDIEPVNRRGRAIASEHSMNSNFADYYIEGRNYIKNNNLGILLLSGKFRDGITGFLCGTSYGKNPWLLPDGRVVTCMDAKEKASVVARVSGGRLKKMMFKDQLLESYISYRKECERCYAFVFCGGGCPLKYVNEEEKDNLLSECEMIRRYWRYVFDKIVSDGKVFGWDSKLIESKHKFRILQMRRVEWK